MNRKQARSRWAEILGHDAEITGHVGPKYPSYKSIASILSCGLDQRPLDAPITAQATQASLPLHENVRGPGYYH